MQAPAETNSMAKMTLPKGPFLVEYVLEKDVRMLKSGLQMTLTTSCWLETELTKVRRTPVPSLLGTTETALLLKLFSEHWAPEAANDAEEQLSPKLLSWTSENYHAWRAGSMPTCWKPGIAFAKNDGKSVSLLPLLKWTVVGIVGGGVGLGGSTHAPAEVRLKPTMTVPAGTPSVIFCSFVAWLVIDGEVSVFLSGSQMTLKMETQKLLLPSKTAVVMKTKWMPLPSMLGSGNPQRPFCWGNLTWLQLDPSAA